MGLRVIVVVVKLLYVIATLSQYKLYGMACERRDRCFAVT